MFVFDRDSALRLDMVTLACYDLAACLVCLFVCLVGYCCGYLCCWLCCGVDCC